MERSMIAVVAFAIILAIIDSVSSQSACTNGCDVEVTNLQVTGIEEVEPDKAAKIPFAVTFKNNKNNEKVTEVTAAGAKNFDCEIMFTTSNIEGNDPTEVEDAVATATKTRINDETKQCTVTNAKDMSNQLLPNREVTLYGTCPLTLKKDDCAKANFICVGCPRPTTASYTADPDSKNNVKCAYIRPKIICNVGRKCFTGEDFEKKSKRCEDPNASCVVAREGEGCNCGPMKFGCTSDANYCKDKKCCKVCKDKDDCNTKPDNCEMSVASSVRSSSEATLGAAILTLAFCQAQVVLAHW